MQMHSIKQLIQFANSPISRLAGNVAPQRCCGERVGTARRASTLLNKKQKNHNLILKLFIESIVFL